MSGDEQSFRRLYEKYWNRIFSTALAILQSHDLAMDAVQETFTTLWKNREKLAEADNLEAYVFICGRNQIISLVRKRKKFISTDILSSRAEPSTDLTPERAAAIKDFRRKILEAASTLPPKQAEVFRLSRFEELDYEEIAERMDISVNTVRNHLVQALNFMRSHFRERGEHLLMLAPEIFFVFFLFD